MGPYTKGTVKEMTGKMNEENDDIIQACQSAWMVHNFNKSEWRIYSIAVAFRNEKWIVKCLIFQLSVQHI